MTNTEKFFIECVKKGIKGEKIAQIPDALDYRQLYTLCATHSMSVIVFKALEQVKDALPEKFFSALQASMHRHVVKDVQSEYDIQTVLTALENHGLRYMPLKGYHLKKLYPSTDMRYASDCDVLIDVEQLKEVRALMQELGLTTKRHDEHHDIVYYPETKTIFELHKTIFVGPLERHFGVGNEGFAHATVKDGYQYFYEMDRERFYVSILAHSAYHFAEGAGVGIRHLTDVYLYRKAYSLNEEYLAAELEKCGLTRFCQVFERAAAVLFDDMESDEFTKKIIEHILQSSLLENEGLKAASNVAAQTNDGDNGAEKAKKRAFWRKIFPKKEHMLFSYPVLKKAVWLLPVFYIVRWFHVLFTRPKNVGKLKRMMSVENEDLNYMKEIRLGLGIEHL